VTGVAWISETWEREILWIFVNDTVKGRVVTNQNRLICHPNIHHPLLF
jgi:hypothetical protein